MPALIQFIKLGAVYFNRAGIVSRYGSQDKEFIVKVSENGIESQTELCLKTNHHGVAMIKPMSEKVVTDF